MSREYADLLDQVIRDADAAKPRTRQAELGPSDVGGCARRASYKHHGVEPTDVFDPHPSAMLGTWLHEHVLPLMAAARDGIAEVPVTVDCGDGLTLSGTADLWLPIEGTLLDLKTVGAPRADGDPVREQHAQQVHLYAQGLRQAGFNVDWVGILYLDRSKGGVTEAVMPFDPIVAETAMGRYRNIATLDPEMVAREERGPGLSWICDHCPWVSACWPGGDQTVLAREGGVQAVADALARYDAARAVAKEAKAEQDFAAAILRDTDAGEYGGFRLKWSKGRTGMNQAEAKALLAAAGLEVPLSTSRPSIDVSRIIP